MAIPLPPWLSVVAVSRNDGHGGDLARRTRLFMRSLAWQARAFRLPTELVLVEWNPPHDAPPLAEELCIPAHSLFTTRIITVPAQVHMALHHAQHQPLFQMIGKNVGLRRARGEFLLATNVDVLLDDALFEAIAQRALDPRRMYRAERWDVRPDIPEENHRALQRYLRTPANLLRRNRRRLPGPERDRKKKADAHPIPGHTNAGPFPGATYGSCGSARVVALAADAPAERLFTNACGDFTLMHGDAWRLLRGYGEFETQSLHLDSVGCVAAHAAGYLETSFLPPLVCYHLEHGQGTGAMRDVAWNADKDARTRFIADCVARCLPILDDTVIWHTVVEDLRRTPGMRLNSPKWGLRDFDLKETVFTASGIVEVPGSPPCSGDLRSPSALHDAHDAAVCLQRTYYRYALNPDKVRRYARAGFLEGHPVGRIGLAALTGLVRWLRRLGWKGSAT
ncbi:MAG: hypothetical protein LBR22_10840 [Desulfovibrio sp.]|jgi:hypothetical protein|nr:hypothetical protein [Desulfovibrio sp.]